jgi:hypothetical protein
VEAEIDIAAKFFDVLEVRVELEGAKTELKVWKNRNLS